MDGIVLWVDAESDKAMIWCSDHGDLAYVSSAEALVGTTTMPEVGTMVSIKTRIVNGIRFCYQLTPLQRNAAPELAQALRNIAAA
ncbi:hypothetical protein [Celeribacter neptunius]|nr:hypothetical protein [Celeribacter neptunius]